MAKDSDSHADWFKWVVGITISLLAAGGGIVAILNYVNSPPQRGPNVPAPQSNVSERPRGAELTNNNEVQSGSNKSEPSPSRTPELRLDIRTPEDICKLVEFLQYQTRRVVYLKVDFIRREYGGITDLVH